MTILARIRSYDDFRKAMRTRRQHLGMSQMQLDCAVDFEHGYTWKLENRAKHAWDSLTEWLGGLGVELLLVPITAAHPDNADFAKAYRNTRKKLGIKGAAVRNVRLKPAQKRHLARVAARARWSRHRPSRSR